MRETKFQLNALHLHLLAMLFMLLDHLWATVVSGQLWMTCVGRIAFPIFAFLTVEGYAHTHNVKKYLTRMLVFALISEIPANLMFGNALFYPYHQNVLWTFLIALLCMAGINRVREKKGKSWWTILAAISIAFLGFVTGSLGMVDYFGAGVLTVLIFYFFRGRKWYHFAGQFACLYWINMVFLRGQELMFTLFGQELSFPTQGFALLALIPIWLYQGKQGPHNKAIQYACYAFYPVHMLILALIARWR